MNRKTKVELANDLLKTFGIDFFDEEGTVEETVLDALVYLIQKYTE